MAGLSGVGSSGLVLEPLEFFPLSLRLIHHSVSLEYLLLHIFTCCLLVTDQFLMMINLTCFQMRMFLCSCPVVGIAQEVVENDGKRGQLVL